MTKAQLRKAKAELKRLEAIIAKGEPEGLKVKVSTKKHHVDGYVYVVPEFDDPEFCKLFKRGPERITWGATGKGHPRWNRELGLYSILKSELPK